MKTVKVSAVVYEMLLELSKKKRVKPDSLAEMMIKEEYAWIRR
jgi:hypothetical protein